MMRETARKISTAHRGESTGIGVPTLPKEAQSRAKLMVDFARAEEVLSEDSALPCSAASAKRQELRVALVYAVTANVSVLIIVNILRVVSNANPSQKVLLCIFCTSHRFRGFLLHR